MNKTLSPFPPRANQRKLKLNTVVLHALLHKITKGAAPPKKLVDKVCNLTIAIAMSEETPTYASDKKPVIPGQIMLPGMAGFFAYEVQELSDREETFCWELLLNGNNLTDAYQKAFGCKRNSARASVHDLLAKPSIIKRLEQIRAKLAQDRLDSVNSVIDYHSRVLTLDRSEFLDHNGNPKPVDKLSPLARSIVDLETSYSKLGTIRLAVKVPERIKAAQELARIHGLNKDNLNLSGKVEGDGIGDIERSARVVALLNAARARRDGQPADGADAQVGAAAGAAE